MEKGIVVYLYSEPKGTRAKKSVVRSLMVKNPMVQERPQLGLQQGYFDPAPGDFEEIDEIIEEDERE